MADDEVAIAYEELRRATIRLERAYEGRVTRPAEFADALEEHNLAGGNLTRTLRAARGDND